MAQQDPWALIGDGASPVEINQLADAAQQVKPAAPSTVLSLISAGLLFVAAVAEGLVLWIGYAPLPVSLQVPTHNYMYPQSDFSLGWEVLALLVISILQVVPRTRRTATALAAAAGLTQLARSFSAFRPSNMSLQQFEYLPPIVLGTLGVAGVISLTALVRAGRAGSTGRRSGARSGSVLILSILGLAAAAAVAAGTLMDVERITVVVDSGFPTSTDSCCGFSSLYADNWLRAQDIAVVAVVIGFAIAAFVMRDRMLAAAFWAGPALAVATYVVYFAAFPLLPAQSLVGWNDVSHVGSLSGLYTMLLGYWLMTAGVVCLLAVAIVRSRIGRRAPLPEAAEPDGTPAESGEPPAELPNEASA